MADVDRELLWLRKVRDFSHQIAEETNVSKLIAQVLDAAIEITGAERGFLVRHRALRPGGKPKFKIEVARGFDRATLQSPTGSVSRTVVKGVLEDGCGVVTTREEDAHLLDVPSVQERRVLSILCVPMRLRNEVRGVLYLDHRFHKDAFDEKDLEILGTFAVQSALALETAEARTRRVEDAERLGKNQEELNAIRAQRVASPTEAGSKSQLLRYGALVGGSAAMRVVYERLDRMARTAAPVLILGESGTGKELVARELHARSDRRDERLLSFNCAAVNDTLLESELFGHRKGAFTGAEADRAGLFVQAGEGLLFLDEVGDMSAAMQAKLLRVLQEGCVRPVGADRSIPVTCRVVAATHRDLAALLEAGEFREDLYYRLDVLRIMLPPLRERREDVEHLFDHFVDEMKCRLRLSVKAAALVRGYHWPGNVRQLQNEVRRLAAMDHEEVRPEHLSAEIQGASPVTAEKKTLGQMEREMVEAALRDCDGNKAQAARQLGIPRSTLYHLIDRYKSS